MYTGQLGAATVSETATAGNLVGAAIGVPMAGSVLTGFISQLSSLFTGSSYDATHQTILQYSSTISANPNQAATGTVTPGPGYQTTPQGAWLALRCWAGDQSILAQYKLASGDPAPNGCGCETAHGCRTDAQTTVAQLKAQFPQLVTGLLSSAPEPGVVGGGYTSGSSIVTTIPNVTPLTAGLPTDTVLLGLGAVALLAVVAANRKSA